MKMRPTQNRVTVFSRAARRHLLATAAGVVALTLVVDPAGLGSAAPAFADPIDLNQRSQEFAEIVDSLGLGDAIAAETMSGSWGSFGGEGQLTDLPTSTPDEDEQVVVLTEGEGGSTQPASLEIRSDEPPTSPPEPVDLDLGGIDVTVAPPAEATDTPQAVKLRVAGDAETALAGVTGILLDVTDASEEPVANPTIVLTVSYSDFAGLGGGEWASRLRFVWIPDCETPGPDCRPIEIPTVNDGTAGTVTATVPVEAGSETTTAALAGSSTLVAGGSGGGSLAIAAGASGSNGSWASTSLAASATWGAGGSTGAFSWSLPIDVPTVPAGPSPDLSIAYSSASSDGKVPSSNNQSGSIGEGFDLTTGYIERSYIPCWQDDDGAANNVSRPSGDLCWGKQNATMVFNGSAVELIQDGSTNNWRAKFDDGTLVQRILGSSFNAGEDDEYWKVTTADGTQYYFGRNKRSSSDVSLNSAWTVPVYGNHAGESCYDSDFAESKCKQVWRWNLEYVVDTVGNSMTYFYSPETNYYDNFEQVRTAYYSGGHLNRIEYGTRQGHESAAAPAKITFAASPRCIENLANPSSWCESSATDMDDNHWLDSPTDLVCGSEGQCTNGSPIFFDKYRLSSIATWAYDGTTYQPVDTWLLAQRFSGQGEGPVTNAEYPMLVLDSITHIGQGGTTGTGDDISVPPTKFAYTFLANRVDTDNDNATEMARPRVTGIRTDSGAGITVNYRTECEGTDHPGTGDTAQANNSRLCYPVKWYPDENPVVQYFHKYVVETIVESGAAPAATEDELITGSLAKTTRFTYEGAAVWKKPTGAMVKPKEVTYSEFRGFGSVLTTIGLDGDSTSTRTTYYRGTNANLTSGPDGYTITALDETRFQGQAFSTVVLNDAIPVSQTVTVPGSPVQTALNDKGVKATRIPSNAAYQFTFDASGAVVFRTKSETTSNADSQVISIADSGDVTTSTDDTCTTITYATSTALAAKHIVGLPALTEVVAKPCGASVSRPADLISSSVVTHDDLGRTTRTERLDPVDGVGYVLVSEVESYDPQGRPLQVVDVAGNRTTFEYTPSAGGLPAKLTTTAPDSDGPGPQLSFVTKSTFNPLTGTLASTEDASGRVTTGTYDSLGRLIAVRYPQHESSTLPSVEYVYSVDESGLNSVVTKTLAGDGSSQHISSVLYDGLLRPFQYQSEGLDAGETHDESGAALGRNVSHVYYDSAGNVSRQTGRWWATGAPGGTPIVPLAVPPSETTFDYDSAGRTTAQIFWVGNTSEPTNEKWRTTTDYNGARTLVIPPAGGTPQATFVDARGRTIELRQYLRDPDAVPAATTAAAVLGLPHQSTTYEFDVVGQMVEMHDPQNNEWSFDFDWGGRQISATDPDAGMGTTTYDSQDRVITRTNGAGETVAYTYDNIGRTLTVRDGSVGGTVRVRYAYDQAEDAEGDPVLGLQSGSTRYVDGEAYMTSVSKVDAADRPLTATVSLPDVPEFEALASLEFTTKMTYTVDGQVSSVRLPAIVDAEGHKALGAETITTRYDSAGVASWMSGGFGWGTYVAQSRYGPDGRMSALDLGNTYGAYLSYSYEAGTERLSRIALRRQNLGAAIDLRYGYDAAGNVVSMKDQPTGTAALQDNQCFGYDGLQRLSVAWTAADGDCDVAQNAISDADVGGVAPSWTEYGYDPLGNRTSLIEHGLGSAADAVTSYAHAGEGPHQVTGAATSTGGVVASTTYTYDDAGRRASATTGGSTTDFSWDREGKLVGVDDDSNVFDAAGNRLVRADEDGITVYLGGQEVHIDGSEVKATRYYSFAGATVAVRTSGGLGGVSSFVTDHQGSVVASVPNTDWSPSSVKRIYTDPFGAAREGSSTIPGDRRFLGAVQDAGPGLVLLGARFYDQVLGRFVSVDPVLDPGTPAQFNAYSYAWNNPVTRSDPTGLAPLGTYDTGCHNCGGGTGTAGPTGTGSSGGNGGKPGAEVVNTANRGWNWWGTPSGPRELWETLYYAPQDLYAGPINVFFGPYIAAVQDIHDLVTLGFDGYNAKKQAISQAIAADPGAAFNNMLGSLVAGEYWADNPVYAFGFTIASIGSIVGGTKGATMLSSASKVGGVASTANSAIAYGEGLGRTALTSIRLQHGTKNLTKAGVLPAWSGTSSPAVIERSFVPILEHPAATFDHVLGGTQVRGFLGEIDGVQTAVFIYKEGPYQGMLASSFIPTANQLKMWGVQ